jgi:hypothetical protein
MHIRQLCRSLFRATAAVGVFVCTPVIYAKNASLEWSRISIQDPLDDIISKRSSLKYRLSQVETKELLKLVPSSKEKQDISDELLLLNSTDPEPLPKTSPTAIQLPIKPRYSEPYSSVQQNLFLESQAILEKFSTTTSSDLSNLENDLLLRGFIKVSELPGKAAIYKGTFKVDNVIKSKYVILGKAQSLAKNFHGVFLDVENRKLWDKNVISITKDQNNVIEWVSKYPWPLANRKYIFRQSAETIHHHLHVVISAGENTDGSRSVDHAAILVKDYISVTGVKPGKDDQSCEYCTIYSEDAFPSSQIPSWLENQAAKSLLPALTQDIEIQANKNLD